VSSNKISGKGAYTLMRVKNNTQRFEAFVQDVQESFWGDFQGRTREMLKKLLEADAEQQMADYLGLKWHERAAGEAGRTDYRNGFYERDYVTPLGVIRLRIPRTRERSFLPRWIGRLQRRAPEVAEMIRQAFLRGISTRQVGRVVAVLTGESVSAQTVSQLTRVLDQAVQAYHQRTLGHDWAYLVLDGVWLKVRRAFGPQNVLLLVGYGIRRDGRRELLAYTRARSESQAGWEGLLNDLYGRGLRGAHLQRVITDGCPGLARALETVYPRARHQRCWVHKMRNILEKVRRRDEKQIKAQAQKMYLAENVSSGHRRSSGPPVLRLFLCNVTSKWTFAIKNTTCSSSLLQPSQKAFAGPSGPQTLAAYPPAALPLPVYECSSFGKSFHLDTGESKKQGAPEPLCKSLTD
jgi:putative transposase